MNEMVEVVAVSFCVSEADRTRTAPCAKMPCDGCRINARAAIAAMRRPTGPMLDAAILGDSYWSGNAIPRIHRAWEAMIDAALAGAPAARPSLGTGSTER